MGNRKAEIPLQVFLLDNRIIHRKLQSPVCHSTDVNDLICVTGSGSQIPVDQQVIVIDAEIISCKIQPVFQQSDIGTDIDLFLSFPLQIGITQSTIILVNDSAI